MVVTNVCSVFLTRVRRDGERGHAFVEKQIYTTFLVVHLGRTGLR